VRTFEDYIKNFGFVEYPFSTYTTENEKGKENDLFIPPGDYSPIIQGFNQNQSLILLGDRGTGKTAILLDFERNLENKKAIFCLIDDFSTLKYGFNPVDFYKFIISRISIKLFEQLLIDTRRLKLIRKDDKVLLSYLLQNFVPSVSKRLIKDKIEKIQISLWKRTSRRFFNPIRNLLNWGTTAGATMVDQYIAQHFKGLPLLNSNVNIKEFFPELPLVVDDSFDDYEASYQLLEEVLKVIKKLGYKRVVVLLDKIDEDNRLENNGEEISEFIKPILTDNKLLLNSSMQIVISMWTTPFNYLLEHVRTQKHNCPRLNWYKKDLENVLNRRLATFSNDKIKCYKDLFSSDFLKENENKIFELANKNPRDLWHVFDKLMRNQYRLNSSSNKIENSSVSNSFEDFVKNFNYYEYYPRKKNARGNSMDFYSYTAHLLKLDSITFTRNQLNDKAGTGGSTQNYVVSMERIGLVEKSGQDSGVIQYRIRDPKVIYALENKIKIEK